MENKNTIEVNESYLKLKCLIDSNKIPKDLEYNFTEKEIDILWKLIGVDGKIDLPIKDVADFVKKLEIQKL